MPRHSTTLQQQPFWRGTGAALLALVTIGSLTPVSIPSLGTPAIPHLDKLIHFSAYALLAAWYLAVFPMPKARLLVPAALLTVGLGIEWLQGMTGYREADLIDAAANLSGILVAPLLVTPLRRLLGRIESRLGGNTPPPRRLRRQGLWQVIGLHLTVTLLPAAFLPIELASIPIPHLDKVLHFVVYGLLTAWLLVVFPGRLPRLLIPLLMLSLSITVELMQGFTPYGGDPSLLDALADTAGILLASAITMAPLRGLLLATENRLWPQRNKRQRRRSTPRANTPSPMHKRRRRRRIALSNHA